MADNTARKIPSLVRALAPIALLTLGACATPFRAEVSRFEALPDTVGQSFIVVADDPALSGGLEFAQYAGLVAQKLQSIGYRPVSGGMTPDLVVKMAYDIDKGREKVVTDYSGFDDPFYYSPRYSRLGYYGRHYPGYRLGFYDPFLFGGAGFGGYGDVRSFTVYTSNLNLKIDQQEGQKRLFEGTAQAQSRSRNLTYLVPNLVEAMFTGFPGNSGETVKISVAPEKK
jgi:hypothetical protein